MSKFIADTMTLTVADGAYAAEYSLCITSASVDKSYTLVESICAAAVPTTERQAGAYTWSMSIEGNYDTEIDLQNVCDGESHAIVLDSKKGASYSGNGFLDVSLSLSTTDLTTFSLTITGDGALTEA